MRFARSLLEGDCGPDGRHGLRSFAMIAEERSAATHLDKANACHRLSRGTSVP
ncbi:MAG: hypothetical protein ACYDAR_12980 [Thermomicrobiales bacterium]